MRNNILKDFFGSLADVIRIKLGEDNQYPPTEFAEKVGKIDSKHSGSFHKDIECFLAGGISEIESLIIGEETTTISAYAYRSFVKLTEVITLGKITEFGAFSFDGCKLLERIDLSNAKILGNYSFRDCTNLKEIEFGDDLSEIGVAALAGTGWYNGKENGVVYASKLLYALKGDDLYSVNEEEDGYVKLQENTKSICREAFKNKKSLQDIEGPVSSSINADAFAGCTNLKSAKFFQSEDDSLSIGVRAFQNCASLETLHFDNLTHCEVDALSGCTSLKSIYILNREKLPINVAFLQRVKDQATIYVSEDLKETWEEKLGDEYSIVAHTENK